MSQERTSKIGIIGAGSVGATVAYACLIRGVSKEICLYDTDRTKVEAEVLDLNHGMQFVQMASVCGSDDMQVLSGADVIVITSGGKQKGVQTRMELAVGNADMLKQLIPDLLRVAPNATLLMVTNPVDVLTYIALKLSGLPREKVFGSGTVLDSSRFRCLIAQKCKVAVQNVHAYIAGEHGDSEIPLWSSATISNIPLAQWAVPGHGHLSAEDQQKIFFNVRTAGYQILRGKGVTNYAVALAVSRVLEAVLHNEGRILPVSSLLTDYRGMSNVCLSIPCIVNRSGVEQPLPIPMSAAEETGLKASAEAITKVVRSLGF